MSQLILDLRDNTGGVMESAVELCAHFLPKGALIVAAQGRKQPRLEFRSDGDTLCAGVQLALLINESTASASEIVAGAIQDHDRGVIVGRRSFGKGLIQDQFKFHDGSLLRLTVARYYTPTGGASRSPMPRQ
jgi:carboxyl-terminal processing protease